MKDIMLDLETWGNGNNAVAIQIGACYFNRLTGEIGDTFEIHIDANDEVKHGFEIDASTIYWWFNQSEMAQVMATGPKQKRKDCYSAWDQFNQFAKHSKRIWSHATFDFVIMMNHFRKLGIKPHTGFRDARDLRTLVYLANLDYQTRPREGVAHNALDDCKFQVKYAAEAIRKIVG
jgi:exodeoxyribonuclease VIII